MIAKCNGHRRDDWYWLGNTPHPVIFWEILASEKESPLTCPVCEKGKGLVELQRQHDFAFRANTALIIVVAALALWVIYLLEHS